MVLPDPETLPQQALFTVSEICKLLHVRSADQAYSYMREMGSEFMARPRASVTVVRRERLVRWIERRRYLAEQSITDGLIARIAAMDVDFVDGRCVVRKARGGNRGRKRMAEMRF